MSIQPAERPLPTFVLGRETLQSLGLLIAAGCLLGNVVVLSRASSASGLSPVAFAFWQSLIGGVAILLRSRLGGRRRAPLTAHHLRYYLVTGLCSIALPNTLLFLSVPHIGAGRASIAYAFPPLLTYFAAVLLRLERPHPRRLLGLALGALGALLLVQPQWMGLDGAFSRWTLLILLAPLTVAAANIYRTLAWPEGAAAETLAGGTLIAAALWIAPLLLATGSTLPPADGWLIPLVAGAVSAGGFALSFALQRQSGPVTFSQLGYVVIAIAMAEGALFFGERIDLGTVVALAVVLAALLLTTTVPAEALARPAYQSAGETRLR